MEKNYSGEIYEALNADLENASKDTLLDMRDKLKACLANYQKSLVQVVEKLSTKDKKKLYDAFSEDGSPDKRCYYMCSIDDSLCEMKFSEAIRYIDTEAFDIDDEAYWTDKASSRFVSGTVEQFLRENFDAEEIADWILDNRNTVLDDNDEMDEWLEEYAEVEDRIIEIEDRLLEM